MEQNKPKLLVDTISYFDIGKDFVKTQTEENGDIILTGILQRAEVPNQNGRIYPRHILEREINKLLPLIKDNQITGQLDHPECIPEDTDIMTKDGWKNIKDISNDEEIYTLNSSNKKIELHKIIRKIDESYKGKMIHIKNRQLDILVTPNHRIPLFREFQNKNGTKTHTKFKFVYAEDLNKVDGHWYIPKQGFWKGEEKEYFVLPEWKGIYNKREVIFPELKINMIDWLSFLGLWLAEGHVSGSKGGKYIGKTYSIGITQTKNDNIEQIQDLLDRLPFKFSKYNGHGWYCSNIQLHSYLFLIGNSETKYIPYEIKQLSSNLLSILFEWMMLGDGRKRKIKYELKKQNIVKEYVASKYNTISNQLINDIQEILFKMGISSNVSIQEQNDRYIDGRLIEGKNSQNLWNLHISTSKNIYVRTLNITKEDFDDRVYCVTVPNEIFYIRRNGYSCWTGNSAIVEFDTSAVKVVDVWWEGNDVMGKVQVLKGHPSGDKVISLLNNKVKVGISSRALGTTTKAGMYEAYKQYGENDVVNEDLNLITWDIVSNPSTHGAFLVTERMINEWNTKYLNNSVKNNSYELSIRDKKLIYFINKYGK